MANANCTVNGCHKPTRSKNATLCAMHYHRQYRHGDVNAVANRSGITASRGRRYINTYSPGHPLAGKSGKVYAHRAALYDKIGMGPHQCHWCNTPVDWTPKGSPDCLHVDHLNGIGDDNRPTNLVPSCAGCNSLRGMQARHDALVAAGFWSGNDTVANLRDGRKPPVARNAA